MPGRSFRPWTSPRSSTCSWTAGFRSTGSSQRRTSSTISPGPSTTWKPAGSGAASSPSRGFIAMGVFKDGEEASQFIGRIWELLGEDPDIGPKLVATNLVLRGRYTDPEYQL